MPSLTETMNSSPALSPLSPLPPHGRILDRKPIALGICAVLVVATLLPLSLTTVPPLVDYPNHLARMWILAHAAEIPDLARNYAVHWRILPDLGMDLVISAFSVVMPVEQAGRVFIALTILSLVGGTVTLHRALHGRFKIWPIWSVLFIYNAALFWGFLSCLFATGIYLFAFSGWIATRDWRLVPRLLTFSAIASVLLLLHLFAFGLYALSVGVYELAKCFDRRVSQKDILAWCVVCLQFAPGVLLGCTSLAHGGSTLTAYGDWSSKLYALAAPFTFGYQPAGLDLLARSSVVLLLIFAILFLIFAILTRSLKLRREMRFPLAAMIIAAAIMPNWLSGSWSADIRLPVALPFVIIASTRVELSRKRIVPLTVAALLALGLRIWTVSQSWHDCDRLFGEFRGASAVIAPGARLLVVAGPPKLEQTRQFAGVPASLAKLPLVTFIHMAALAVIDRGAFFPYLFTGSSWKIVEVTPRNEPVSQAQGVPMTPEELTKSADPAQAATLNTGPNFLGERPYWRNWPETFDFVLWIDFEGRPKPQLEQLRLLTRGSFFEIYSVVKR
jgi:hypothetical protein